MHWFLSVIFVTSPFFLLFQSPEWKRYALAKTNLTVELPVPPEKTTLELSGEMKDKVKTIEAYQASALNLFVMVSYFEYKEGVVVAVKSAAEGAVSNMQRQAGLSDFTVAYRQVTVSGKKVMRVNATYRKGTTPMGFSGLYIVEGQKLWQVNVGYFVSDRKAQQSVERILGSVRIIPAKS